MKRTKDKKFRRLKESKQERRIRFHLLLWLAGMLLTLLKGIWTDPWGVGFFDLDFLTILTAYLFLSSGHLAAGCFALGQGILLDLFSSGMQGLFPTLYLGVFWGIAVFSRFFNLREVRGQCIIVALAVLFKQLLMVLLVGFFSRNLIASFHFFMAAVISIFGSAILAPLVFMLLNGLRALPQEDEEALSSGRSNRFQEPTTGEK